MPVCVAQIVQKGTVRDATACHDGNLVSVACHGAPLVAQPPATRAWKGPQSDTLVDVLECGYRVAACCGKRLAAAVVLLRLEACRPPGLEMPWLVFPASSSCRGLVALLGRVARRGKFLGMPWLAFPASSSCRGLVLNTLFLNGSIGTMEDLGGRPASLAAGRCNCPCTSSGY